MQLSKQGEMPRISGRCVLCVHVRVCVDECIKAG